MADTRVHDFIEHMLARGCKTDEVREMLAKAQWPADEIDAALADWTVVDGIPVPTRRRSIAAGEAFQYLLLFATFFMGAGGLMDVLFGFINRMIPPIDGYANYDVKYGVATLIVSFPVYAYLYYRTSRDAREDANRRESPVRRWLIHLTLLVTAVSTITGLVSLIVGFLEGRGDVNGGTKMLVMVVMSVATFGNYQWELRRANGRTGAIRRVFVTTSVFIIIGALLSGIWTTKTVQGKLYDEFRGGKPVKSAEPVPPPAETTPVKSPSQ